MSETFCCMICRLLQDRSPACLECGATTMVSLVSGSEALKYESLAIAASSPRSRKETIANATGTLAIIGAYAGICLGAAFWWPAIPIILGTGVGAAGLNAALSKKSQIADIDMIAVALAHDAVEKTGVAHKLTDSVKALDGDIVLVEQLVVGKKRGVLLRKTNSVPFLVDVDGQRIVVTGIVRVTSEAKRRKLAKSDLAAIGAANLSISGVLDTATIREGDRVTITGALATEIVPELAFHRDAGETAVMRGVANAVVAIQAKT